MVGSRRDPRAGNGGRHLRSGRAIGITLLFLLAMSFGLAIRQHRRVLLLAVGWTMEVPTLAPPGEEGEAAQWFDDYFTVHRIDAQTYAIGETRYYQRNFNYLLVGRDRAILLDTGPGVRDIRPVIESLTDRPVTVVASHLHYDHVGNHVRFERGAMIDLPHLRERVSDGRLPLTADQHLGSFEGFEAPLLPVTEWWADGQEVDLGGRRLRVLHTPGHTAESVVLHDPDRDQFFTGETLYPGELYAFLPGSSLGDYAQSTESMLGYATRNSRLYGAHRAGPSGLPVLGRRDLVDLRDALLEIHSGVRHGDGVFPKRFEINEELSLLADFAWGRRWE